MSEFEDLSAKAARLWLEFMQAQAKAAASAAASLPEVTRSLAEAGVPLAAEMNRWIDGARPPAIESGEKQPQEASHKEEAAIAAAQVLAAPAKMPERVQLLAHAKHRRLKTPKSMSRRRARRA